MEQAGVKLRKKEVILGLCVCECMHAYARPPRCVSASTRARPYPPRVRFSSSPHAVPDRLRLRVNRISLQEYDRLQYDKERLRDICKAPPPSPGFFFIVLLTVLHPEECVCVSFSAIPVGIVVVRGDCDLETCRLYIDRLQEASLHHLPRHPSLLLLLLFIIISYPSWRHPSSGSYL